MTTLNNDEPLGQGLGDLFNLANEFGNKRYHRLTPEDFQQYRAFDYWRYVDGDFELGTTEASKQWVWENSDRPVCPVCNHYFSERKGRTIDHKLPRAQYPWLSMDFRNLWVICWQCNREKGEMGWYEYETYILEKYPERYDEIQFARPQQLLKELMLRTSQT
jgi:hypothetical protein